MPTTKVPLMACAQQIFQGLQASRYQDGGLVPYRVVNVRNLEGLTIEGFLSEEMLREHGLPDQQQLKAGDVAVALRGASLKASVVPSAVAGSLASQNLAVIRPLPTVDPIFLAGLLRSRWIQRILASLYVQSGIQAQAVQVLTVKQLRELEIPLPTLEEQRTMATGFQEMEQLERLTSAIIATQQTLVEAALARVIGEPS